VRARLNVLSEIPGEWQAAVERWSRANADKRLNVEDDTVPDANEEYLVYQTLVGAWPLEPYSAEEYAGFVRRIQEYMNKVLHEAKVHSSWLNPNEAYDAAMREFVGRILDESNRAFLEDLRAFRRRIVPLGMLNSLAQTLLRLTLPGVPDTYQGTELWDFSLVDPDNRRPVDYEVRRQRLAELQAAVAATPDRTALARQLTQTMSDGRIKLYITWQGLCRLREHRGLFSTGEYVPLELAGACADRAFAFLRRQGDTQAIVVVPRLVTTLVTPESPVPLGMKVWRDTRVLLPAGSGPRFRNTFTGESLTRSGGEDRAELPLSRILAHFPVALLVAER